eukprot:GSMAST32.ASY1.ANO1.445.1 assembled CDS
MQHFLTFIVYASIIQGTFSCTNYMVTRGASNDNSTIVAYNSDGFSLFGYLKHLPAQEYVPGTLRDVYDFTSGKFLGSIPEVSATYNVVGNTNSEGLSIAETTFDGIEKLAEPFPGSILDYYSLMWITLQRTKTAREAIATMDILTSKYGYASTGESFSIADTKEVWIMEMIGRGLHEKGTVWVARKIPNGAISGHANQARIESFPLNSTDTLYSSDIFEFSKRNNLTAQNLPNSEFNFAQTCMLYFFLNTFDPITSIGARACDLRVWNFFRLALGKQKGRKFADKYLEYVKGYNLSRRMPLFGNNKVSVNDTMWAMRDRYQNTWFDQSGRDKPDISAGPFHSLVRTRPLAFELGQKKYSFERNVCFIFFFFV